MEERKVRFANNQESQYSESGDDRSASSGADDSNTVGEFGTGADGQSRDHKSKTKRRSKNDNSGRDF
jgi:hypothetical protein